MPPTQSESNTSNSSIKLNKVDKETVIIFDWDDTLLASSYLSGRGFRLDTEKSKLVEIESQLKELENSVIAVISLALQYGSVCIITNAETGWVQLSAQKFLPGVVSILNRVSILSARSTYESRYPESPLKWKFYAFQERLSNILFNQHKKQKNILSFGDSHVEREAVRAVTRGAPNTKTKSVKFAERPSMEQLRRQIELVTNCFQYIHNHEGDLDLQLTVTINNTNNNSNTTNTPNNNNNNNNTNNTVGNPNNNCPSNNLTDNCDDSAMNTSSDNPNPSNSGHYLANSNSCDREANSEVVENNSCLMQTNEEKPIEV